MCLRGAFEHGCEYAPVAGQYIYNHAEILSAPSKHHLASVSDGRCSAFDQSNGKTVSLSRKTCV